MSTTPANLSRLARLALGIVALMSSLVALAGQASAVDTVTVSAQTPLAAERTASQEQAAARRTTGKKSTAKKLAVKETIKPSRAARQRAEARRAVKVAKRHIGDPYRWGATGPRAFDCSGLVQFAWRKAGVRLPRNTWSMRSAVRKKVSWGHLKPGDLIFTSGGGHVGMYVGNGKMIHAPHAGARVRINRLGSSFKRTFVGAVRPGA